MSNDTLIRSLRELVEHWRQVVREEEVSADALSRDYKPKAVPAGFMVKVGAACLDRAADELAAVLDRPAPPDDLIGSWTLAQWQEALGESQDTIVELSKRLAARSVPPQEESYHE